MYETDLFADLVAAQPPIGHSSLAPDDRDVRRLIIADHARAVTFLIADGVYPSNTDRGYVLRFLARRAIRNGKLLGYPNGFMTALVPHVAKSLAPGYPELRGAVARIEQALGAEELAFERTLERGSEILAGLLERVRKKGAPLAGRDVFTLHDTYGFPSELTREIAAEAGVAVDLPGFGAAMEEQRARARADAARKRAVVAVTDLPAIVSEYTGYDGLETDGTVVSIVRDGFTVEEIVDGDEAQLILDRTSFYAEKGGQIGDRGVLRSESAFFEVADTQYVGEAIAHIGAARSGELRIGDRVTTEVYAEWRREIRRHHTSAHLLQRALKDVLGDDVTQAGSWVGIDRMRFDFRWPHGALELAQKHEIARRVNEMIRDDTPLETRVLPIEEARASGAIMMFGEKYGDKVRVVQAGPSVEFCGGTHSHSTGELGLFVMLSEFSIGSGIRRIESCVSKTAEEYVERQQDLVGTLATALATSPEELGERIEKIQTEVKELQNAVGALRARLAAADAQSYVEKVERQGDRAFVGAVVPEANSEALRHLSSAIRQRVRTGVIALAGLDNGTVNLLVSVSDDMVKAGVHAGNLVKLAAPLIDGRGGGQPAQAQGGGKNPAGADDALRAIREAVLS